MQRRSLVLALVVSACFISVPNLHALANRVFVSARSGDDANSCDIIATPCQTLAGAVLQLTSGGEAIATIRSSVVSGGVATALNAAGGVWPSRAEHRRLPRRQQCGRYRCFRGWCDRPCVQFDRDRQRYGPNESIWWLVAVPREQHRGGQRDRRKLYGDLRGQVGVADRSNACMLGAGSATSRALRCSNARRNLIKQSREGGVGDL